MWVKMLFDRSSTATGLRQYATAAAHVVRKHGRIAVSLAVLLSIGFVGTATADTSSSAHYKVEETQFGAGASLQQCSGDQYCAKTSVGDTTVGSTRSANYSAEAGFNTSDVPLLEVIAINESNDMGVLDTTKTGTALTEVKVRSYLSSGYVMEVTGDSPSQGSHNLDTLTTPTTSQQGQEQFGLNLAANSTPNIGADPVQVPSSAFSFGVVTANYNQANKFMYQSGDVVAQSASSTGETDYMISFIANITNVTAAGRYTSNLSAVVVATY